MLKLMISMSVSYKQDENVHRILPVEVDRIKAMYIHQLNTSSTTLI